MKNLDFLNRGIFFLSCQIQAHGHSTLCLNSLTWINNLSSAFAHYQSSQIHNSRAADFVKVTVIALAKSSGFTCCGVNLEQGPKQAKAPAT